MDGAEREWRPGIEESWWGALLVMLMAGFMVFTAGVQFGLGDDWFVSGSLAVAAAVPVCLLIGAAVWLIQAHRARGLGVTARRMFAVSRMLARGRVPEDPREWNLALYLHDQHRRALPSSRTRRLVQRWLPALFVLVAVMNGVLGTWWQFWQMLVLAAFWGLYQPRAVRRAEARVALMDRKLGVRSRDADERAGG